jgi:flagellar biosynthesis GTPase FlhF
MEAQLEEARKAAEKRRIEAINREKERVAKEQSELAQKAQLAEQARKERLEALRQQAQKQAEALRQQQLARQRAQQQARESAAKQKAAESASQSSQKRGFSLSFASNTALEHLLRVPSGISLYLIAGGKSWRLEPGASLYRFLPSGSPGQIYDMDLRTVPDTILRAGRKVVAAFGAGQTRYGVKLTSAMQNRISQLMAAHDSGDLIIAQSGDITIEE